MNDPRKTHRFIDETDTAMCGTRIESYPIDYSEPGRVTCLNCKRMMDKDLFKEADKFAKLYCGYVQTPRKILTHSEKPAKSPSSYPLGGSMPYGDAPCPKPILCGNTYRDWPPFTRPKNHYGEHTSDLSTTTHCTWGNHDQPLHLRLIDKVKEILRVR